MPTKAGRVRVEDIRVGRTIYDIGINWDTFAAVVRPLKIVYAKRVSGDNFWDLVFQTQEPEGHVHTFRASSKRTLCGFYGIEAGTDPAPKPHRPVNFFVNARAAQRYMERMRLNGDKDWQRWSDYEALGRMPAKPRLHEIGKAATAEMEKVWARIHADQHLGLQHYSRQEIIGHIRDYLHNVAKEPPTAFRVQEVEANPDGSISFAITGSPELMESLRQAQQKVVYSMGSKDFEGDTITHEPELSPEAQRTKDALVSVIRESVYDVWKRNGGRSVKEVAAAGDTPVEPRVVIPEDLKQELRENGYDTECKEEHRPDFSPTESLQSLLIGTKHNRTVQVEALPADPDGLRQGYSWPVKVSTSPNLDDGIKSSPEGEDAAKAEPKAGE